MVAYFRTYWDLDKASRGQKQGRQDKLRAYIKYT